MTKTRPKNDFRKVDRADQINYTILGTTLNWLQNIPNQRYFVFVAGCAFLHN